MATEMALELYYGMTGSGKVIHLLPFRFQTTICGMSAYPLRRPMYPSERVCINCERERSRRQGQHRLW